MKSLLSVLFLLNMICLPSLATANGLTISISGNAEKTSSGPLELSLEAFEAIDQTTVVTKTPWHKEDTRFTGVSGAALVEYLGIQGEVVEAVALNDYLVEIPVSDLLESGLIFATRANGELMSVREKGPVFVVYPFDTNPSLKSEIIYGRSIWQLVRMNIR